MTYKRDSKLHQKNNTRLRNICTVLQYDPTAFRNGRMIMTSQALRVWYMYDRLMKDY